MAGARTVPTAPINPHTSSDFAVGISEVENDRAGNARFGYAVQATEPSGIAAGNVGFDGLVAPDAGPTPFTGLKGKR